jgi:hypothetical protein
MRAAMNKLCQSAYNLKKRFKYAPTNTGTHQAERFSAALFHIERRHKIKI